MTDQADDGGSDEKKRTLWVGGAVNATVDEELLYELFINAGPIENIHIPTDKERKQPKNFAFVTFRHEESVDYAIQLFDRIRLFGKELIMKKRNFESGGGRNHFRSISAPAPLPNNRIAQHQMPPPVQPLSSKVSNSRHNDRFSRGDYHRREKQRQYDDDRTPYQERRRDRSYDRRQDYRDEYDEYYQLYNPDDRQDNQYRQDSLYRQDIPQRGDNQYRQESYHRRQDHHQRDHHYHRH